MNCREVAQSSSGKSRGYPVAATENLIDYVRPTAQRKTKMIVIHSASNDITNKFNTM